jgi:hypothetical protein
MSYMAVGFNALENGGGPKAWGTSNDRQYKVFPKRPPHYSLGDPDAPEILKVVAQWILDH